jgi:hypothetical protein
MIFGISNTASNFKLTYQAASLARLATYLLELGSTVTQGLDPKYFWSYTYLQIGVSQ